MFPLSVVTGYVLYIHYTSKTNHTYPFLQNPHILLPSQVKALTEKLTTETMTRSERLINVGLENDMFSQKVMIQYSASL